MNLRVLTDLSFHLTQNFYPFFPFLPDAKTEDQEALSKSESGVTRAKRKSDYLTAYACEGSTLNITGSTDSDLPRYLNIIRANYGRFSIAICNDHGNTDWSVNCYSPVTLRVIKARYDVMSCLRTPFRLKTTQSVELFVCSGREKE